ncbi:MAG: hypothetical protein ACJ8F3_01660 [Xanthobacteraceae bacterium]
MAAGKSTSDTTVFDLLRTDLSVQTASHDFDGHGKSGIAWQQNGGAPSIWLMNGAQITSGGSLGVVANTWSLVGQRDFDRDGKSDWLWRNGPSGTVAIWLLDALQILQTGSLGATATAEAILPGAMPLPVRLQCGCSVDCRLRKPQVSG